MPPVRDGPHLYSQFNAGHEAVAVGKKKTIEFNQTINFVTVGNNDLQHAVSSSVPSSQSRFPSHNCVFAIHFGVPFAPPRGHKNLLSGHAIAVQLASSLSSEQS